VRAGSQVKALARGGSSGIRLARRALRAGETALAHAAAGLLDLAELRRAIEREWDAAAAAESPRWDEQGLFDFESELVDRFVAPASRVLLVGCGGGRDLLPLVERGHRIEAFDPAPRAVERARRLLDERGLSATLSVARAEDFEPARGQDAIVFSWFVYSYLPGSAERVGSLRRLAAALAPGGRVIVTYLLRSARERVWPVRLARLVARARGGDWLPEDGDVIELSPAGDPLHYEHRFAPGELAGEVRRAGLEVRWQSEREGSMGRAELVPAGQEWPASADSTQAGSDASAVNASS
jgi:SAM-dependent methyltransferase